MQRSEKAKTQQCEKAKKQQCEKAKIWKYEKANMRKCKDTTNRRRKYDTFYLSYFCFFASRMWKHKNTTKFDFVVYSCFHFSHFRGGGAKAQHGVNQPPYLPDFFWRIDGVWWPFFPNLVKWFLPIDNERIETAQAITCSIFCLYVGWF